MSVYRSIHTNLFSKKAEDIIKAALKNVEDHNVTCSHHCRRTASFALTNVSPNGELLVEFDDNKISSWRLVSYVRGNDDIKARKWLAWQIKDSVNAELEKNGDCKHKGWKRDNKAVCATLTSYAGHDVTIHEAYCVYDLLSSRKNVARHYGEKLVNDIVGTENDPFKTEMEVQRREQIKLITNEYADKIDDADLNNWKCKFRQQMDDEILAIRKRYREESEKLIAELKTERDAKLKELNEQFAAFATI